MGGGESHFLLSVPQDSSDGWEKGHRMALSSGSPVSEDVWVLIKMCRASGDATPTSTTTPPPLLSSPSLAPSLRPRFPFVSRSRLFSPLPLPSLSLPSQTLHVSSIQLLFHPSCSCSLLACDRTQRESQHWSWTEGMPLGRQLPFRAHVYVLSLSLSFYLFLFVSPWGHMPRMCRHFLRIRGVRYFCPRTRRILFAHPWTVRFEDVWGWWSSVHSVESVWK